MESSSLQKTPPSLKKKHIYFSILRRGLLGCISQKREERKKSNTHIFNSVSETDNNCRIQEKHSETPCCDKTLSWERECRALMHLFKSAIQWFWAVFFKERSLLRTQSNKQSWAVHEALWVIQWSTTNSISSLTAPEGASTLSQSEGKKYKCPHLFSIFNLPPFFPCKAQQSLQWQTWVHFGADISLLLTSWLSQSGDRCLWLYCSSQGHF